MLDILGVENVALVVDKDKLNDIPVPFLAYTSAKGFLLVENVPALLKAQPGFMESWNGVVVAAEKPAVLKADIQNEKWLGAERSQLKMFWLAAAVLILFIAGGLVAGFGWIESLLLLTSLAGAGIASLIVMQELGVSNPVTEQLCNAGKQTDCNAVIKSKGAALTGWLKWSDIGIIYFFSMLLMWISAIYTGQAQPVMVITAFIAVASLPFTIFSLYYQQQVVKKWCTLCLITLAVLWVQSGICVPLLLNTGSLTVSWLTVSYTAFTFFLTTALWLLLLKPLLFGQKEQEEERLTLLKFKRSPELFTASLEKQRKADITPFSHDLQIANANAPVQIMVACNPYCGPCARAHEVLHELAEYHGEDIGITVRFTCRVASREDKKTIAIRHIMQYIKQHTNISHEERVKLTREVLHTWFAQMDYGKFEKQFPVTVVSDVDNWMEEHEQWCNNSGVTHTPTVFINGFELVRPYTLKDIPMLLLGLKESEFAPEAKASSEEVCS
ncbi:MAG: vitamin K epoxide reductase family protein [Chitinophagaceae bacterium]